jgi:hypothetical protein
VLPALFLYPRGFRWSPDQVLVDGSGNTLSNSPTSQIYGL